MEYFQKGGPVMYPLLACSVIALAVITERLLFWMRLHRSRQPGVIERCLTLAQDGRFDEAAALAGEVDDPTASVIARGILERQGSPTLSMEMQARATTQAMQRYLGVLDTMITVAPLLGIYGTITGIIRAFGFLSAMGVPDPKLVADGIAEALITTAAGLTIAIPTIPVYNYFVSQARRKTEEIERHATALELLLGNKREPVADETR